MKASNDTLLIHNMTKMKQNRICKQNRKICFMIRYQLFLQLSEQKNYLYYHTIRLFICKYNNLFYIFCSFLFYYTVEPNCAISLKKALNTAPEIYFAFRGHGFSFLGSKLPAGSSARAVPPGVYVYFFRL